MIQQGSLFAHRFQLQGLMAEGALGQVWSASDTTTGDLVALKLAALDNELARRLFEREGKTLLRIESAYLPEVVDTGVDAEAKQTWLATKMVEGQGLDAWQKGKEPHEIWHIYAEIARGLAALHRAGVAHRDVKPTNILVRESAYPPICLLDLGFAVSDREPDTLTASATTVIGTPAYLSPEGILGRPLGPEGDIFALGVMLFEALAKEPPWPTLESIPQMLVQRLQKTADFSKLEGRGVPREVSELIQRMLQNEPTARPSADEVSALLSRQPSRSQAPSAHEALPHPGAPPGERPSLASQARPPAPPPAPALPAYPPAPGMGSSQGASAPLAAFEDLAPISYPPDTVAPAMPSLGGGPSSRIDVSDTLPLGAPLKSRLPLGMVAASLLVAAVVLGAIAYWGAGADPGPSHYSWQPTLYALLGLGAGASLFYVYSKRRGRERSLDGDVSALAQRIQALETGSGGKGGVIRAEDLEAAVQRSVVAALEARPVSDVGKALDLLAKQLGSDSKKPSWDKRITNVTGVLAAVLAVVGATAGILGTFGLWTPNHPPVIRACGSEGMRATRQKILEMRVDAVDSDDDPLVFAYKSDKGSIEGSNNLALLDVRGVSDKLVTVTVEVRDDHEQSASRECPIRINVPPEVNLRLPAPAPAGTLVEVSVEGSDSDGDALTTGWQSSCEGLSSASGRAVFVKVTAAPCRVIARVSDTFDTVELAGTIQPTP